MDSTKKICPVCERPETTNERYWHHYGALCCLSCKAFFRRYHRQHKKVYSCKTDGHCDVRFSVRKKKCKFNSDVPGLDISGFGRARAFMYRASGGPGFFVSGFGRARAFPKYKMYLYFCYMSMKYEVFQVNFFD